MSEKKQKDENEEQKNVDKKEEITEIKTKKNLKNVSKDQLNLDWRYGCYCLCLA